MPIGKSLSHDGRHISQYNTRASSLTPLSLEDLMAASDNVAWLHSQYFLNCNITVFAIDSMRRLFIGSNVYSGIFLDELYDKKPITKLFIF